MSRCGSPTSLTSGGRGQVCCQSYYVQDGSPYKDPSGWDVSGAEVENHCSVVILAGSFLPNRFSFLTRQSFSLAGMVSCLKIKIFSLTYRSCSLSITSTLFERKKTTKHFGIKSQSFSHTVVIKYLFMQDFLI